MLNAFFLFVANNDLMMSLLLNSDIMNEWTDYEVDIAM